MKKIASIVLVGLISLTTGCGTVSVMILEAPKSMHGQINYEILAVKTEIDGVPQHVLHEIRNYAQDRLGSFGVLDEETTHATHRVKITITGYHMRTWIQRLTMGLLAGIDKVTSMVTVTDAERGGLVSEFQITAHNTTAYVGPGYLIKKHGEKIADVLSAQRKSSQQGTGQQNH